MSRNERLILHVKVTMGGRVHSRHERDLKDSYRKKDLKEKLEREAQGRY